MRNFDIILQNFYSLENHLKCSLFDSWELLKKGYTYQTDISRNPALFFLDYLINVVEFPLEHDQ